VLRRFAWQEKKPAGGDQQRASGSGAGGNIRSSFGCHRQTFAQPVRADANIGADDGCGVSFSLL
jgi:hypothetical protein